MKNKLALFDLDGTLFDTNRPNFLAYQESFKEFGYDINYDYFVSHCSGKDYKSFIPLITKKDTYMLEEIHNKKKIYYKQYLKYARCNEHLFNIIEKIREEYFTAVVTTASRTNCFDLLKYFKKDFLFDLVIAKEDVSNLKPDPECFLKAMQYFNIDAGQTMIFEDSEIGLTAAKKTNAAVFAVNNF